MPEIAFLKAALADLKDAREWYDEQQLNLGLHFLRELESSVKQIKRTPQAFPFKYGPLRQKMINKFPYFIFYFL
ncbi:MAG: type II toxin-antitoxin system RelE/ParE family toxin [Balneolaceae bacterium]